ncbi:MAG: class I SAM-dependent methyltransferase [Chloroflexi bacterium]|nr:class I SAM-dependent methyltransferase [Chloroflexota bacterium]
MTDQIREAIASVGDELSDPLFWRVTELAHQVAQKAMDNRANVEINSICNGKSLEEAHGEAIRDYSQYQALSDTAFQFLRLVGITPAGCAVDMGSGTGVGATILSKYDTTVKIYAVEFSSEFVHHVMPMVFSRFNAQMSKIQRVVGDFNNLEVPDSSLDVVLDFDSFHHSEDLDITLHECFRVLKPGGLILAVDRAWSDKYTREELDAMLDVDFPDVLKKKYGIPVEQRFTRRDYGEHEYTVSDWLKMLSGCGFDGMIFQNWMPPLLNRIWRKMKMYDLSLIISSLLFQLGARRLWRYGYVSNRVLIVGIKKEI